MDSGGDEIMLCQFIVKNFKSFRDEVVLDMQAVGLSEHKDSLIVDGDGEAFVPVAAIYGPNGGGKSNIIEALVALKYKIMKPICSVCEHNDCGGKERKMPLVPFLLDPKSKNKPIEFTLFFRTKKAEYRYVLHVLKEDVIFETLDKKNINGTRYTSLFERVNNAVTLNGTFKKLQAPADISDTITTISYLAITHKRHGIVKDVVRWFESGITIDNFGNPFFESRIAIPSDPQSIKFVVEMLSEMDIDVSGLRTEQVDEDDFEVYFEHTINGKKFELPVDAESSGTKKILGFLPDIYQSLAHGTVLCVDEMDSKLHPILMKYIVGLYTSRDVNKNGAQLIFTSHDLANMNNEVYRRDEIWFVAKNNEQVSNLYSLVELRDSDGKGVRKDAKYAKQYLEGKYGADPFLRQIINWGEIYGKELETC